MKPKLIIDSRIVLDVSWFTPPLALQLDDQTREPVQSGESMKSS